jgi:predicted DNA-binding transcriptional regulator YafY
MTALARHPDSDERPAAERPQICRMRLILEVLQRPRTTQEITAALEINPRTFHRDLKELRALGFVIEREGLPKSKYGRYILKGWQL